MLFVSDNARQQIENIKGRGDIPNNSFVRVTVTSGGCSGLSYNMEFDQESKPHDQVFEDKGVKIVTDLKSFLYVCNSTLEFSGGLNGRGFHFTNPNASRECACGESFSL